MLEDLLFSLDRVMPFFLLIVLGTALRKCGIVSREFFLGANKFTFKVGLPFQLFSSIARIEHGIGGKGWFMLYVFVVTLGSVAIIWAVTEHIYKDKSIVGTLVQGGFRGNYLLIGAPLAISALGPEVSKTAALAAAALMPSYNILAVIILSVRGKKRGEKSFSGICREIVTNPIIISILCALPFLLLRIKLPQMVGQTVDYVAQTAIPLGLLSIGGLLNISDVTARIKPAIYASSIKCLLLPAFVMTISLLSGFRGEELFILFMISASPVAISSYVMAREMGGDAPLASNILILSTFSSGFVLALGIYLMRIFSLV